MTGQDRLRVAVLSEHPRDDIRAFSGIPYHLNRALEQRADVVAHVQVPPFELDAVLLGGAAGRDQLERIGAHASRELAGVQADVVLCCGSSMIPYLDTDLPVVLWHDSTWHTITRLPFEDFSQRHPFLREFDQAVLDRCALIAYAADWVRESTLAHYPADPRRLHAVPFGANLPDTGPLAVDEVVAARDRRPVRLTFIGVDWERKGLVEAHRLLTRLEGRGVDAVLTVLGGTFDRREKRGSWEGDCGELERAALRVDPGVRSLGFVDKRDPAGLETYRSVLLETHFLVHPATFECFGIVLAEAAAYGVPVLALDGHGPGSIVRDGTTGHLFPADSFVEGASDAVLSLLQHPDEYARQCRAARSDYEQRLNWGAGVDTLLSLVRGALPARR